MPLRTAARRFSHGSAVSACQPPPAICLHCLFSPHGSGREWLPQAAIVLGFVLLAPVGYLYLVSGLVVPQPWLAGLWVAWVALTVDAVRHRKQAWRVLATPVVAIVIWVGVVMLGGALLRWTA